MKRSSIKLRLTLWYTLLMLLMAAVTLTFVMAISSSVANQTVLDSLDRTLRENALQADIVDGELEIGSGFGFYRSGIYTVVYSKSQALLAGQLPQALTALTIPFENGLTRPVETEQGNYYVMDLWLPSGWEDGIWLRGMTEISQGAETRQNLLAAAGIAMPLFILLGALGGWLIVRRALRPLDSINATAAAINEGRDLSARIELGEAPEEFRRLGENFDRMLERLERAFEAEKRFTSDASHELRTPLSVILSACEYSEKFDETVEEQRETIQTVHRQGKKMAQLINQLLQMTRLDQGTEKLNMELLDLSALGEELCRDQGERCACLKTDILPGVKVRGDRLLLTRLIQNLLDNAYKYGKPGGSVWLSLRREGGQVQLSVRDEGEGIAPELQEKIWQRFYQADPSRSGAQGAGLGLAMVEQIARLHGGDMSLESRPGEGSVFTLRLPAAAEDAGEKT